MSADPILPFARPSITSAERAAVIEVLDSGWLSTGPKVREFEARFAEYVGALQAAAVNSGTAGLHLALEALGVGAGDEVIVPTWTFASTANVAIHVGARPVIVDVDPLTLNMTPEIALAAVTPRTKAVMAVHIAGRPMQVGRLVEALDEHGIPVVEDAAHSFPSRIGGTGGRAAGTIGRVGVFSFYATKTITTGEGGMVVSADAQLMDRIRQMSLHGISRSAWKRYEAGGAWYYEIEAAGYKYNLTDIAAAIGLVQLARADELLEARRDLRRMYASAFSASPVSDLVELPIDEPDGSHAWHLHILRLNLDRGVPERAEVIRRLAESGIGTSVHFIPLHMHPYYRVHLGERPQRYSGADGQYPRVISLPIWPGMTPSDIERVVDAVGLALGRA